MLLGLRESRFSSWPSEGRGLFFMRKKLIVFASERKHARAHAGHMITCALAAPHTAAPVTH